MSLEGRIAIDLACDGGKVVRAAITPPRALPLAPILGGLTAADAVSTLSTLFSVCAMAQSAVAVEAAEAALEIVPDRRARAARGLLVLAETFREHLLHIGLHSAKLTGEPCDTTCLRGAMALPAALGKALFPAGDAFVPGSCAVLPDAQADEIVAQAEGLSASLIHDGAMPFAEMDREAFTVWSHGRSTAAARLAAFVVERDWTMAGVSATAALDDAPADTTCLTRQKDAKLVRALLSATGEGGVGARLTARFIEASGLPGKISAGLAALRDGRMDLDAVRADSWSAEDCRLARANVEAARGLLEHQIKIREGKVVEYAIQAPTSIHFGAHGIAVRSLGALSAPTRDELATQADMLVRAIDPCVAYDVRFH